MNPKTTPWWETLYDDLLSWVLLENTDEAEVSQTVKFLTDILDLSPKDRIFDQCCGTGRLSHPFIKQGYPVIGVDLIPEYIEKAKMPGGEFTAADAFTYFCMQPCDAAFNWWTSFGYSQEDEINQQMLEQVIDSLKPGGKFALDYMNTFGVLHNFQPEVITHMNHPEKGDICLNRTSWIDPTTGTLHKTWTYQLENEDDRVHTSSVRLYDPPALEQFFKNVGFKDIKFYGNIDHSSLKLNSPRCIVLGTKI